MPVVFVPEDPARGLRVDGAWAYVPARFVHPDGRPLGAAFRDHGMRSDDVEALLRRTHGRRRVVAQAIGASDQSWRGWIARYHAPRAVFPPAP